jgi:hypothetical protein
MPHTQNLMIIAQNNFKVQHSSVFYYIEKIILRLEFVQINPIYFFSIKHVQKLCNYVVYIFGYTFFLLSFRAPFYFSLLGLKFPKMALQLVNLPYKYTYGPDQSKNCLLSFTFVTQHIFFQGEESFLLLRNMVTFPSNNLLNTHRRSGMPKSGLTSTFCQSC